MTTSSKVTVHKLSTSGITIAHAADDIRGSTVRDKDGEAIGKVQDLVIDDEKREVRFLLVHHSGFLGFGQTISLIPVDAIVTISKDEVSITHDREHVIAAPPYDPELIDDPNYHKRVSGHYGCIPFRDDGYTYPPNLKSMFALRPIV